jgi:hypothetical protein
VPELVALEVDDSMASCEPDEEVQDLLRASGGTNLGVDLLPGAIGFDPAAHPVDATFAASVTWLDAFTSNVDRSWRNPNLLVWHGDVWLIDHGASLIFHHAWPTADQAVGRAIDLSDHVLAPRVAAGGVRAAHASLAPQVTRELLYRVLSLVPDVWLRDEPGFDSPDAVRAAYAAHLVARLARADEWLPEVAS